MMLESGPSDLDILTLPQEPELHVVDVACPELVAIVHHSQLTRVVIYPEHLDDLDLEVEIIVPSCLALAAEFGYVLKLGNIPFR